MKKNLDPKLDSFTRQYLETALWSSTDDDGILLDRNYSISDFSAEAVRQAKKECTEFKKYAGNLLDNVDDDRAGHDFWLTRNRHGAGFWDGDYPRDVGAELTKQAHVYGSVDIYVGDDGKLRFS